MIGDSASVARGGLSADELARADALVHELPFLGMAVAQPGLGVLVQVNDALCRMLGFARAELLARSWAALTHPDDLAADVDGYTQVQLGVIDGYQVEKRLLRSDGEVVHVNVDVRASRSGTGAIEFMVAMVADLTARVAAESAVREAAALLERFGRQIPGVFYQYLRLPDGMLSFPYVSDGLRDVFEIEPEMARADARSVFARVHPDDRPEVEASVALSERTMDAWRFDFRVILPRQGVRWLHGDARPERLGDGSTLWHGYISDITERQLERAALLESEQRFRVQIEHAPEAIMVFDTDSHTIVDANTNAERLFGLTRDELLERNTRQIGATVQADGRLSADVAPDYLRRALAGEALVFEWLYLHSSGREVPCEVRLVRLPAEGRSLLRGSITDISERKRSAAALTRLEAAIDSSINGVAIADLDGTLQYGNRALLELWGYSSSQDVVGRQVSDFWANSDETSRTMANLEAHGAWTGEMTAVRADGEQRLLQVNASLFPDAGGAPVGMLASFADITEQRQTEHALRVRDEAIRTAITAIAIGDRDGRPVYVNPAFVRLWGYDSEAEVLSLAMADFLADGASLPHKRLDKLFESGAWQGELKARRKNGSTFDMLATTNVVRDASGTILHLMGSFLDITESKRLQADVLQSQKMESVGRLAGGVAHDFNNLLTVMKGCLGLALDLPEARGALRRELLEINRAADSAAELTRQLLAFSRRQIIAPRILDLNDVVHRVHGMLMRLLGEDIRLQVVTAPGLGAVRFDPGQAEQILLNLAVNARDAMPNGGTLTLETSNRRVEDEQVRAHPSLQGGEYVLLTVSDTGVGMTDETRAHVFEPFFTTKEIGQGTGLGLAMIHGAVSQNGGRVEVESVLGRGTTFRILLPRVGASVSPTAAAEPPSDLPRGTETLVLVEDDARVRQLMLRLLERQGYTVFTFPGGSALLEWLSTSPQPIQLLITDVIMPGMNGKQLAERVRELRPGLRVLFASGYTADVVLHHGQPHPGTDFLSKPFTAASLSGAVRGLLDTPPG